MLNHSCPPVLFIIFNRPELTQRVFSRIREARPKQLFVAADGPRSDKPEDIEKCRITRSLIQIDWDCELNTLYSDKNLGCGVGPVTGINWFFENVHQGIILEDDCLPSLSFFSFCGELLDYYNDNIDVMAISGTNILSELDSEYSFIYSYYGGNWGWATWRRAWVLYDYEMKNWKCSEVQSNILNILSDKKQFKAIKKIFDKMPTHDAWDYQWFFTRLSNKGLSIVPVKNLISNIGYGKDATHTKDENSYLLNLPVFELEFPLKYNYNVKANNEFDYLNAKKYGFYSGIISRLKLKLLAVWRIFCD